MVYIGQFIVNRYNKNIIENNRYDYFLFGLLCEILHILELVIGTNLKKETK